MPSILTKKMLLLEIGTVETPQVLKWMLLARRLVEAGTRFVTLTYGGWDMHDLLRMVFVDKSLH